MRFGKKTTFKQYLHSKVSIAILVVLILLMGQSVYERYMAERKMAERRYEMEMQLQTLLERKELLQARVDHLSGDRGIEEEIRSNFDVAKEGEQVVILMGETQNESGALMSDEAVPKAPWWMFWR